MIDHPGSAGAGIVIVGSGETFITGGNAIIKIADAGKELEMGGVIAVGEEESFAPEAATQSHQELDFVNAICPGVQRVSRGCQVRGRRNGCDSFDLRRSIAPPLPCQLQGEIPAWYSVGVSVSVLPQLRMFMRTTFIPAAQALLPVPITY